MKQENVLKSFKDGKHKVIIATSVAEEGLDVRQCNWIIRYEHVTNAIARVQSRGKFLFQYVIHSCKLFPWCHFVICKEQLCCDNGIRRASPKLKLK